MLAKYFPPSICPEDGSEIIFFPLFHGRALTADVSWEFCRASRSSRLAVSSTRFLEDQGFLAFLRVDGLRLARFEFFVEH